jgi:hypothetical protein
MTQELSTRITGWAFVAAAVMLWFGWLLLPVRLGSFFQPSDFAAVYDQFHFGSGCIVFTCLVLLLRWLHW